MNLKKVIYFAVTIITLLCLSGIAWGAPVPADGTGDVNGSQAVDIVDALMIAQYSVGLSVPGFNAAVADVNRSGNIEIIDALMTAQYSVGLITAFPAPVATPTATRTPTPTPTQGAVVQFHCEITDGIASEDAPDSARIRLWSTQSGTIAADGWSEIKYTLSGTAVNGSDYQLLSGSVYVLVGTDIGGLPAGASKTYIDIIPIWDNLAEGTETVVITCLGQSLEIQILDSTSATPPDLVTFADPDVEARIRTLLNLPTGDITLSNVLYLTNVVLAGPTIDNLGGLELLPALKYLDLNDTLTTDITTLGSCKALIKLNIRRVAVSDISPLAGLKLQALNITDGNVTDISVLAGIKTLKEIWLINNHITDITPLGSLDPALMDSLVLQGNDITDFSPLFGLTVLRALDLTDNNISILPQVTGLPNLDLLRLSGNHITDITPLYQMQKVTRLYLANNNITSFDTLGNAAFAGGLRTLDVSGNPIAQIALVRNLGIYELNVADTLISSITFVGKTLQLRTLNLLHTFVTDLSPLDQLLYLTALTLP